MRMQYQLYSENLKAVNLNTSHSYSDLISQKENTKLAFDMCFFILPAIANSTHDDQPHQHTPTLNILFYRPGNFTYLNRFIAR